jgi:hypothetical protein
LIKANTLLAALNKRDLYKFVTETTVLKEHIRNTKNLVNSAKEYLEKATGIIACALGGVLTSI